MPASTDAMRSDSRYSRSRRAVASDPLAYVVLEGSAELSDELCSGMVQEVRCCGPLRCSATVTASWAREAISSLVKMCETWVCTVRRET